VCDKFLKVLARLHLSIKKAISIFVGKKSVSK